MNPVQASFRFSLLSLCAVSLIAVRVHGQTNFPGSIMFDIVQNAEPGGSVNYTVRPTIFGIAISKLLTAPDGTQLGSGPFLDNQFTVATFADLSSRIFGDWTLLENSPNPLQEDSTYRFTLSPFALDDVAHETPVIDSPLQGETVGSHFIVDWSYPSGETPTGRSMSWGSLPGVASVTFAPGGATEATFDINFELLTNPFRFRAGPRVVCRRL